jgi:hypothetical protein
MLATNRRDEQAPSSDPKLQADDEVISYHFYAHSAIVAGRSSNSL